MSSSSASRSSTLRPGLLVVGGALLGACVLLVSAAVWNRYATILPQTLSPAKPSSHVQPFRVEPHLNLEGALDAATADRALRRLRRDHLSSLGDILHALRLFGPAEPVQWGSPEKRARLLDVILDSEVGESLLGAPALIDTRNGVRCRVHERRDPQEHKDRQAHEDQLLSVLAEAGVPLSQTLNTPSGTHTVQRILDDALAKFDLKQDEIEWSALAFALYLPPQDRWADKFGRVYKFDDLAEEMMERKLENRACTGCHILYSLAVILRVDEQTPILSKPVKDHVRSYLDHMVSVALRHQIANGSWDVDWLLGPGKIPQDKNRLSVMVLPTGHLVEWMAMLPDDLRPSDKRLIASVRWLEHQLSTATDQEIASEYCPYSHAGRIVGMAAQHDQPAKTSHANVQATTNPPPRTIPQTVRTSFQGGSFDRSRGDR